MTDLIFLIGFMGTGKTSAGVALARYLGYSFVDMDKLIEEKQQCTINEIFTNQGEPAFRQIERDLLQHIVDTRKHAVVSTGGGIVLDDRNTVCMREAGVAVLLTAEPETVLARLSGDHSRPLLQGEDKLAKVTALLGSRKDKYQQAADIAVKTDNKVVEEIIEEIVERIREKMPRSC